MRIKTRKFCQMNTVVAISLSVLMTLAVAGCYPKPVGPPGYDGKPMTWPEMDKAERKTLMKEVVVPRAAAVFREWRPEKYQTVDCTLCHGAGTKTDNFHMPTAHLPRLSGELLLGPEREKYPDTTRLKLNRLVPVMADALGLKPFSLVTRRGFGCYSCHLGLEGPMFGN